VTPNPTNKSSIMESNVLYKNSIFAYFRFCVLIIRCVDACSIEVLYEKFKLSAWLGAIWLESNCGGEYGAG